MAPDKGVRGQLGVPAANIAGALADDGSSPGAPSRLTPIGGMQPLVRRGCTPLRPPEHRAGAWGSRDRET